MRRLPFIALLAAYLGVTLWLTLRPRPGPSDHPYLVPLVDTWNQMRAMGEKVALMEAARNVLLFVPFGYLLPASFRSLRKVWITVVAGGALAATIESAQWLFDKGRTPSIDDVIYNTIGAGIGGILFVLLTGWRRYRRARANRETARAS